MTSANRRSFLCVNPEVSMDLVKYMNYLAYLNAVINESMRYRPKSVMGLPRVVPVGGAEVSGRYLKEGTPLCVSNYTIHRSPVAFDQPDEYWPERWLKGDQNALKKYFIPFFFVEHA